MNLILFSVTTFAVLDYFYRFMRFVSTDLAKIAKFLCFYSKSGFNYFGDPAHLSIGEHHLDAVGMSRAFRQQFADPALGQLATALIRL